MAEDLQERAKQQAEAHIGWFKAVVTPILEGWEGYVKAVYEHGFKHGVEAERERAQSEADDWASLPRTVGDRIGHHPV